MRVDAKSFNRNCPIQEACGRLDLRADGADEAGLLAMIHMAMLHGGTISVSRRGETFASVRFGDEEPPPAPAPVDPEGPALKFAAPEFTMLASALVDLLQKSIAAHGDAPTYFGEAGRPTLITAVLPSHRNGHTGRVSDGYGQTCQRIFVIA